ncbi:MAG: flavodoxin-dependent (E)-4-hydroxy-3-methylbut-2-enyl-diphosphate synthase, partial [Bacteroidota bacterium]|nr:flavodoxin-dependent (E)-4-hydroxy-3-methylbut-2-enyl-diphosphate synthase [Bacteroidota bacterium]
MKTLTVTVGGRVHIGSDYPIVPQTMCNTHTNDIEGTVAQCRRMAEAGSQLIRITVPGLQDVPHIAEIRRRLREEGIETPLVADIHFSSETAIAVAPVVEKVRINPGNFHKDHEEARRQFARFLAVCKEHGTAIRVGLNHGSLGDYITNLYGNTPFAMAKAAMEWLEMCIEAEFYQVVVSLKASNTVVMVEAYRQLAAMMQERGVVFPMHVGVTEAGGGDSGRIKSCVGISALLAEGIGNTVRVSLTEDPVNEIPVARYLCERYSKEQPVCPQKDSLASLARPLPSPAASSLCDNLHSTGPSPYSCPGVDTPFEGTPAAPCCTAHYHASSREELLCAVACDWGKKLLDKEIDMVKIEGTYVDENGRKVSISPEFSAYLTDELLQACR